MFEDLEALPLLVLALVHGEEEGHDAEAAQQEGAGPQTQTVAASSHLGVNFFWSSLVSFVRFDAILVSFRFRFSRRFYSSVKVSWRESVVVGC